MEEKKHKPIRLYVPVELSPKQEKLRALNIDKKFFEARIKLTQESDEFTEVQKHQLITECIKGIKMVDEAIKEISMEDKKNEK